jgi:hypothetical protein
MFSLSLSLSLSLRSFTRLSRSMVISDGFDAWSTATESTGVSSSISRTENNTNNRHNSHDNEFKRASSRGVIPRAKIKSVKMTLVIVFGKRKSTCTATLLMDIMHASVEHVRVEMSVFYL